MTTTFKKEKFDVTGYFMDAFAIMREMQKEGFESTEENFDEFMNEVYKRMEAEKVPGFVMKKEDDDFDDDSEVDDEFLKVLAEMTFNQLKDALQSQSSFDNIEFQEHMNNDDEIVYLIQIFDKTFSLTTITCDKVGKKIHWGSSTPVELKTLIENVMDN